MSWVLLGIALTISILFCIYAGHTESSKLMFIGFGIAVLAITIIGGRDIIGKTLFRQACNEAGGVTAIIQSQAERVCINPASIEYLEVKS